MTYTTLVNTDTLARNLRAGWCVFDCRFVLAEPEEGERRFCAGHIPGAHYLHLDRDLSGPVTPISGRHPLPDPELLAGKLAAKGVFNSSQVIAYDDAGGVFAARLWWLLRWLGHPQVAVLDGGISQWLKEHRPVNQEVSAGLPAGDFQSHPDNARWVTSVSLRKQVQDHAGRLLDARLSSRFHGEQEPIDTVAGHVPGAVNLPFTEIISENGCFKPPEVLRQCLESALADIPPAETVCMCGSGVTACHTLLAMEVAGMPGGRLYAGSWSEWIRDPSAPVERG